MAPKDRKYAETHEWALETEGRVRVGITDVAIERLSDLVFVDLPSAGRSVSRGEVFGEVESVKAVSELVSPVDGEIVAVNEPLGDDLETLTKDPYGAGWMIEVEPSGPLGELMDAETYEAFAAAEDD